MNNRQIQEGDLVRIIRVPDSVHDSNTFKTRTMIERCVGRTFPVMDLNNQGMLQIDIGELTGRAACMESIWIEPDCVEPVPR